MDRLPSKLPFSKRRLRPRVIISYILDYVIIIACAAGFYILDSMEPFHQHFSLRNITLQYPYAEHERIPISMAIGLSCLAPLVIIAIYTLFLDGLFSHHKPQDPVTGKRKFTGPHRWKDRLWEFNCGLLGLLLAQGSAFVITQVLKTACGKPRPDLIDRCKPREGSEDLIPGLSNYTICTGAPELIKDGFKSWPSGHSSSSFAGLFYLTLWLSGKLHIMDNRGEVWKTVIIMTPCVGATLIAVSRIMDARHHPFDVITGSLLGVLCAYIAYRQYFPPISEPWKKGRAYSIRSWGTESSVPAHAMPLGSSDSTAALRNPEEERLDAPPLPETSAPPQHRLSRGPTYTSATGNPYGPNPYRREDGNWSSSSEEDVADGYEMQHGYGQAQSTGLNPGLGGRLPRYEVDTAYNSQSQQMAGTSPISPLNAQPGNHGRDLTDMPGRAV